MPACVVERQPPSFRHAKTTTGPERELVADMARFDGIALHDDFTVAEDVRIHHSGSDHGDDAPVAADDAAPGGFGEVRWCATGP